MDHTDTHRQSESTPVGSSISAVRHCCHRILMPALRTGRAPFVMHPALREHRCMQECASNLCGSVPRAAWREGTAQHCLHARACELDEEDSVVVPAGSLCDGVSYASSST